MKKLQLLLTSKGSGGSVDPKDFFAEYVLTKGKDGSEGSFSYKAADESWR